MELTNQFIILVLLGIILGILLMARILSGWMRPGYGYGDPRYFSAGYRSGNGFVDALLILVFIALLGFILLGGKDWEKVWSSPEQTPGVQSKVLLSQTITTNPSFDTLETMHYVEDLPEFEVPNEEVFVQVGAFESYHQAQMVVLETRNYISDHLLRIEQENNLYKVRIGPFASPWSAKKMKSELSLSGFLVRN